MDDSGPEKLGDIPRLLFLIHAFLFSGQISGFDLVPDFTTQSPQSNWSGANLLHNFAMKPGGRNKERRETTQQSPGSLKA